MPGARCACARADPDQEDSAAGRYDSANRAPLAAQDCKKSAKNERLDKQSVFNELIRIVETRAARFRMGLYRRPHVHTKRKLIESPK